MWEPGPAESLNYCRSYDVALTFEEVRPKWPVDAGTEQSASALQPAVVSRWEVALDPGYIGPRSLRVGRLGAADQRGARPRTTEVTASQSTRSVRRRVTADLRLLRRRRQDTRLSHMPIAPHTMEQK